MKLMTPEQFQSIEVIPWDQDPTSIPHEFRIYGDDMAQTWCVVDEIDYHWAIQWRWNLNIKKSRGQAHKTKIYLRRAVEAGGGRRSNDRKVETIYLHIEIMKRTGITPPSPVHVITDHRDGNTFNCRRDNLRWATHSMNSRNLFGQEPYDLEELARM